MPQIDSSQQSIVWQTPASFPDYCPPELPDLRDEKELIVDTETTGLQWFGKDQIIGHAVGVRGGPRWYFPTRHIPGGNIDPDRFRDWAVDNYRGKKLHFFNAPFDINFYHKDGIDLEALGCTVSDVAHRAALLDDHRYDSSLEAIAQDILREGKVQGLDKTRMAYYHPKEVEAYAQKDVDLPDRLIDAFQPQLESEELLEVLKLEEECIFATCEMERNGCELDIEKLDLWLKRSEREYVDCLWELQKLCDFQVNPNSVKDLEYIFNKFDLPLPTNNDPQELRKLKRHMPSSYGKVSFAKHLLVGYQHPVAKLVRRAKRLASMRSKYLLPYKECYEKFGKIIYALHQLRVSSDEEVGEAGTISGRYSSSAYSDGVGVNAQQVAGKKAMHAAAKDEADWPYKVRELYIPEKGKLFCAGDADQVEYRWFSHYAQPPAIMAAYAKDPHVNFHKGTQAMIEQYRPITYELTKDCNFAGLFGAGLDQFAYMLGMEVVACKPIYETYHRALPEARELYKRAMRVAEQRGYVKTFLGRRGRFLDKHTVSKAVSRVIQGSAADENKTKLVLLRKAKLDIKLRLTVHDEVVCDVPNVEVAKQVSDVLNTQVLQTRVPLLWTVNVGPNWQECKKVA